MILLELKSEQGIKHPSEDASKAEDTPEQPHNLLAFYLNNFQELNT